MGRPGLFTESASNLKMKMQSVLYIHDFTREIPTDHLISIVTEVIESVCLICIGAA